LIKKQRSFLIVNSARAVCDQWCQVTTILRPSGSDSWQVVKWPWYDHRTVRKITLIFKWLRHQHTLLYDQSACTHQSIGSTDISVFSFQ
jgi:hypothetical protein